MDLLTLAVFAATITVLAARIIEIAVKRPETFLEILQGTRSFAEPKHGVVISDQGGWSGWKRPADDMPSAEKAANDDAAATRRAA